MKRIEKIQFIGMGALGIMFGDFLAGKMGAGAVAFVGDKRRTERFEKEGAYCNEKPCSFSMIEAGKQEVADLLGISQSYISRLEKKIMKRLKKEIVRYE